MKRQRAQLILRSKVKITFPSEDDLESIVLSEHTEKNNTSIIIKRTRLQKKDHIYLDSHL